MNNVVEGFLGYLPDFGGLYGEREREGLSPWWIFFDAV